MTDREREDVKRHLQVGMVLVGAAMLLGSVAGAAFGVVRVAAGVLDDGDWDQ